MASIIVDTVELVRDLIEQIESVVQKPLIFIDLEGVNLSRDGVIAIMQILVPPIPVVQLIDIYTLGKEAFETSGPGGQTLRGILESRDYPKVFFDVRNDSDAMYSHYQISLGGVIDLQLLEFASRSRKGRFIKGLAKCISEDGSLGWTASQKWQRTKDASQRLFVPEKGGDYGVFLERPLSAALQEYCAQDVLVMPKLLTVYGRRLPSHLATQINAETLAHVVLAQSASFNGIGRHMAIGPSFTWSRSRDRAVPEFPMSIVCCEQLADRCSIDEVAVAVKKPCAQAITTGEAQQGQVQDNSAGDIEKVADLLKQANFLDADGEST